MSSFQRRLPVYLLLDCSESMAGEAIEEVGRGVAEMVARLGNDPVALEVARLSLITFAREARQVMELSELFYFKKTFDRMPRFGVRPGTALGAALRLVKECIEREVRRHSAGEKGDYKPFVVLLTDGQPTDAWEEAAEAIRPPRTSWGGNVIAIGCGPDADAEVLRRVAPTVLLMKDATPESLSQTFAWMTESVLRTSQSVGVTREGEGVMLPERPDVLRPPGAGAAPRDPRPRQAFLHARCSASGRPYLMRFVRPEGADVYVAARAHPLAALEPADAGALPALSSASLVGCPPCPYCGNGSALLCDCKTILCSPDSDKRSALTCPSCGASGYVEPADPAAERKPFDLRQGEG